MQSIRPREMLRWPGIHATPVLCLSSHHTANGLNGILSWGCLGQPIWGLPHEGFGHSKCRLGNRSEVVPALALLHKSEVLQDSTKTGDSSGPYLQTDRHFAVCEGHEHVCHLSVARGRYETATKGVTSSGIKPSRDWAHNQHRSHDMYIRINMTH